MKLQEASRAGRERPCVLPLFHDKDTDGEMKAQGRFLLGMSVRRRCLLPPFLCLVVAMTCLLYFSSCRSRGKGKEPLVQKQGSSLSETYDLPDIWQCGELIAATMYGPQTYFEHQGREDGLQFLLAQHFARSQGLKLRIETARTADSLYALLSSGEADVIVCAQPLDSLRRRGFSPAGFRSSSDGKDTAATVSWAVRSSSPQLREALGAWFKPSLVATVRRGTPSGSHGVVVRRKVRAPYLSRQKGVISPYDAILKSESRRIGWDWRLLAAQCYQESGFDPRAVSWAGARGLMQIMPSTAERLGVSPGRLFEPQTNVSAAVRYLSQLSSRFSDVRGARDRICFTLAAYNGGYHHIRDAMSLARKHGRGATRWEDVAPFVLRLSQSRYYSDPVVRYGYMIGSETYAYVGSVMQRWAQYSTGAAVARVTGGTFQPQRATRRGRFSGDWNVIPESDSLFSVN